MRKEPVLTVKATCAEWRNMIALADQGAAAFAELPDYMLVNGPEMPPQVAVTMFEQCRQLFLALCEAGHDAMPPGIGRPWQPPKKLELVSEAAEREPPMPKGEPIIPYRAEGYVWLAMARLVKLGLPQDFVDADKALEGKPSLGGPIDIRERATAALEYCEELLHSIGEVVCVSTNPIAEMGRHEERQDRIASGELAKVIPFQPDLFAR